MPTTNQTLELVVGEIKGLRQDVQAVDGKVDDLGKTLTDTRIDVARLQVKGSTWQRLALATAAAIPAIGAIAFMALRS